MCWSYHDVDTIWTIATQQDADLVDTKSDFVLPSGESIVRRGVEELEETSMILVADKQGRLFNFRELMAFVEQPNPTREILVRITIDESVTEE